MVTSVIADLQHYELKSQGSARECKGLSDVVDTLLMKTTQECSEIIDITTGCDPTISRGLLLYTINGKCILYNKVKCILRSSQFFI